MKLRRDESLSLTPFWRQYQSSIPRKPCAVTCTLGTPYNVALDGGTVTGDPLDRKMQRVGGTATIGYQLFQDHTRTQPWGNTPGSVLEGIGSGAVQSISIHGWIPAHSVTAIGTYQDLVTVTVEY